MTLAAWHISSHEGCNCNALVAELDSLSADFIEANIEVYVEKFASSAQQWRQTGSAFNKLLPVPPRRVLRELIQYGITKHREEANLCTLL